MVCVPLAFLKFLYFIFVDFPFLIEEREEQSIFNIAAPSSLSNSVRNESSGQLAKG